MFAPMVKTEFKKLARRKLLWIEMIVLGGLIVMFFGSLFALHESGLLTEDTSEVSDVIAWPDGLITALGFASGRGLGGLLVVILVSVVVAQEYDWGTIGLWLHQGISRRTVLAAKFAVLLVAAVLLTLAPLVIGGLFSAAITPSIVGELDLSQANFGELVLSVLRTAYSLVPYIALTFLFAVLTRSMAFSIGVGVGYALVIEGVVSQLMILVGGLPEKIAMWLPGLMAGSLSELNQQIVLSVNGEEREFIVEYLDPNLAAVGIAVYTVIFLGLAFWRFQKQDISG